MASLTLKNIPEPLYAELKKAARLHRRSISSEALLYIERGLKGYRPEPEAVSAAAGETRELSARYRLTDEKLERAKRDGRP